jgi:hypothetical protein
VGGLYASPYAFVTGDSPSGLTITNPISLLDAGLASGTLRESNGSVTQTDLINLTPALQGTKGSMNPPVKLTSTLFQDALKPLGGDNNSKLNYLSLTDIGGEPLNVTHITMPSQGNTDLTGVERIQFTDGTLALDTGPNSAVRQAYSLYSLLGRAPDKAGLGYWINALETGSMDIFGIVDSFLNTSKYSDAHGGNKGYSLANTTNVTALYRDLLHREPDQLGLWYWTSNGFNLRIIVSAFLETQEFKTIIGASLNDGVFYTPYL